MRLGHARVPASRPARGQGRFHETAEIRRGCERHLAELDLPVPFDLQGLCTSIEVRRGRKLRVLPKPPLANGGPCGLLLTTDDEDIVFVERATSALHARHILLHELGHIVWDHRMISESDDSIVRQLLPDLDPSSVRWVLSRHEYADRQETEAEMFASLLASNAQWSEIRAAPAELPEAVRAVYAALQAD